MNRPPFRQDDCPIPEVPTKEELSGPFRPVPKCDPPIAPVGPEFSPVSPAEGAAIVVRPLLTVFTIESPELSVTCADYPGRVTGDTEPSGSPVTVAAGSFTEDVFIQNLPLEADDLEFIATVFEAVATQAQEFAEAGNVPALAALFQISQASAALIVAEVSAAQSRLLEQAQSAALAQLECVWSNDTQTVNCPAGALAGPFNPSIVLADTYSSPISKEVANALALAAAEAALVCVYESDEIVVVCSDLNSNYTDLNPEAEGLSQEPGDSPRSDPERVFQNSVTIAAGAFNSLLSKEDANDQARNFALTQLDCFYIQPNDVTATCSPDGDDIPAELSPVLDFDGTETGNPVTVKQGYTFSFISFADAEALALELAQGALVCQWGNTPLVYSCDDQESDPTEPSEVAAHDADGVYSAHSDINNKDGVVVYMNSFRGEVVMFALPSRSPTYTVTISANTFFSQTGRADANETAANAALSQLDCVYCNPDIISQCPVEAASYTIPVPGVPYTYDSEFGWYIPETADLAEFESEFSTTFCGPDAENVAFQADELGSTPFGDIVSLETECVFENTEIYAACTLSILESAPDQWYWVNPVTRLVEIRPTTKVAAVSPPLDADPLSLNSTLEYIRVPHGTFTGSSQEQADEQAIGFALSQLNCFWDNDAFIRNCPDASMLTTEHVVDPGEIQSYVSKLNANELAEQLADSLVTCLYCSEPVVHPTCAVSLPACAAVSGESVEAATATAASMLNAIVQASQECGDGGGGGGGGGGGSGSGSDSGISSAGSDKSTAIVPASWAETGYTALFIMEAPEVRFEDVMTLKVDKTVQAFPIDFRFVSVCEPDSIVVCSAVSNHPAAVGASVEHGVIVLRTDMVPAKVTLKLSGIRRGFAGHRFPLRTEKQFLENEAWINSAYSSS